MSMRDYRERRRTPDARRAVELSRQLTKLASEFPRFKLELNRLQHHVLVQVRSPEWKTRRVLKTLDQERAASVRELVHTTGLDYTSLTNTLQELKAKGQVVACNRAGKPLQVDQGSKVYWRRG
jgi:hypothetical protein